LKRALALAGLLAALSPAAHAQVSRVFVSARSGSDANSCSNIQTPCQTLQGAVNQVDAGGSVLVLDTGGYGPLSIGKAVTIEAPPGIEAFIHPPSGTAITILAGASDVVVLRGLTLNGAPSAGSSSVWFGIDFIAGAALHVEQCSIQGFDDGVVALRGSGTVVSDLYVEDTVIRGSRFAGIAFLTFTGTVRGTVDRSQMTACGSFGLDASNTSRVAVRDTVAAGNSAGMSGSAGGGGTSVDLTIENCVQAGNAVIGVQAEAVNGGQATVRFSDSAATGNGGPASLVWGGIRQLGTSQLLSRVNNTVEGNSVDTIGTIGTYAPR
jgi:hypothetical protein